MKGCAKKKHLEAWRANQLQLMPGDLKMQGTSHKWRNVVGQCESWIDDPIQPNGGKPPPRIAQHPDSWAAVGPSCEQEGRPPTPHARAAFRPGFEHLSQLVCTSASPPTLDQGPPPFHAKEEAREEVRANVHGTMRLKEIRCPICDRPQPVGDAKLRTKTGGFSKFRCKASTCEAVVTSSLWKCRCGIPWIKCPRHILSQVICANKRSRAGPATKAQRLATHGVDKPLPVMKPAVISETSCSEIELSLIHI